MFTYNDGIIMGLSLLTLIYVLVKARHPFKKHSMNIFTHLMLLLIVFGLFGKFCYRDKQFSSKLIFYHHSERDVD